ncbi:MAG: hypothetical protein ACI9FG_000331 [Crocinitomicaceae bacterium]|jgi:hypothetical protein
MLQLTVCLTLAARGWLMYKWGSQIRSLLWNEEAVSPLLEKYTSLSWEDYALESDPYITNGIEWLGIILMIGAVLTLLMRIPYFAIFKWFLVPLWAILALDSFGNYAYVNYQSAMMIEYVLQAGIPLLFLWVLVWPMMPKTWAWVASLCVCACFVGHGLYAVGYHPVPWSFQVMTMDILGISEERALAFLYTVGILDFIAAIAILIPQLRRPGLYYMVMWGGITALARILAHYDTAQKYNGMDPWIAEFVVRTSHWLFPILLLMMLPLWNQNGRLELSLLKISSQIRRGLSKAAISQK